MRPRWELRCVSVDGVVRYRERYALRRAALRDAALLASPFYDVVLSRADGTDGQVLHRHVADLGEWLRDSR